MPPRKENVDYVQKNLVKPLCKYVVLLSFLALLSLPFLRTSSGSLLYVCCLRMGTFFTLVALSGLASVLHYTQSMPVEVSCLFTITSV